VTKPKKTPSMPVNPDQIAVALKYDGIEDQSPEVIASGRGGVAEQILQIAFAEGVKVREDADLAEVLSALDIGAEIPVEAFAAVSEILTYVYRANGEEMPGIDTPLKPPKKPSTKEDQ